ncbi:hypothetical protein HZH66_001468 [Vespula vulgaris]|uniref:Uncharacterized protein n=1 Tax=Vespula vulgaris TaxID=7454 RepID=A0A834KV39_VESVU|nr:hypothetical protein HZH66_001468 [Vespula vulgaris]
MEETKERVKREERSRSQAKAGNREAREKKESVNRKRDRENSRGMPWIKCLGGAGGKARRGKPLSVSQPIHLLVKVRFFR